MGEAMGCPMGVLESKPLKNATHTHRTEKIIGSFSFDLVLDD
jgi:hypothetical protein